MEEARRVLLRLERIEALRATGAGPQRLLAEVRALLAEGEAWVAAEGSEGGPAEVVLRQLTVTMEGAPLPPRAA